ncbi:spore germination protein [Paenibacillus xylaniclasticus]|uniref:spore germination protein n=1 Tax=Paenibacillus xylaniclasticus TaxID=588083 RepID=UPI000FDB40E8|nr:MULTISPECIES: spore germination protein [Paenibacillus]GFN32705.1 spore germination protein [Paenibacillus curdlanolyticus]
MVQPKDEHTLQPDNGAPPPSSADSQSSTVADTANQQPSPAVQQILDHQRELLARPISGKLQDNIDTIRQLFTDCSDVVIHEFDIKEGPAAVIVYVDGMIDIKDIDTQLLTRLQHYGTSGDKSKEAIVHCITISSMTEVDCMNDAVDKIGYGNVLLFAEGITTALVYSSTFQKVRAIEEPQAETVVRGPREGFVESLRDNTTLLRRRLHTPAFKTKSMFIGRYSKTATVITYIEGIADPALINEMVGRLSAIDVDGMLDTSLIEEWVEDNPLSPFPQLMSTERPDVVTSHLLEGRIAVLSDGSPVALIAPAPLMSMMQSPEDFYQRSLVATGIRWLRMLFSFIAVFMPSLYVAVLSFHQEMIPTSLLLTIAQSREQIPFPALVEALLMEITFEALREAGIRLPRQVGSAVSIVGALVIGQAAISAGIVSSPMVMVVAVTAVSSFLIPNYSLGFAIRFIRFPIMLCAGALGLYGIVLCALVVLIHLMTLRSFGVPYLSPFAPLMNNELKDSLIRTRSTHMTTRPHFTGPFYNRIRMRLDLYKARRNN